MAILDTHHALAQGAFDCILPARPTLVVERLIDVWASYRLSCRRCGKTRRLVLSTTFGEMADQIITAAETLCLCHLTPHERAERRKSRYRIRVGFWRAA